MKNKNLFIALLIFILFFGLVIYLGVQSKNDKDAEWGEWEEQREAIEKAGKDLEFSNRIMKDYDHLNNHKDDN